MAAAAFLLANLTCILEHLWQQAHDLFWDHMPIPLIVAVTVLMLTPLLLFRLGKLSPFLNKDEWKPLALTKKVVVNHNTRLFRFNLPYPTQPLGLPLGQHILVKGTTADNEEVIKPYTPITDLGCRGHVDFVIKVYPEGRMSQTMDRLEVGDQLLFKGPKGRFFLGLNEKRALGMIAGGTGITPMYQVARALVQDPQEYTSISLIYANVTQEDILLRKELDELASTYARFKVYYVLNKADDDWTGGVGFISKEMIKQHLPRPDPNILIARCGPPAMNKAMRAHLLDLEYKQDMLFEF